MRKNRKLDFICNTIGSLIYALNSVILLMAVVQILGSNQGGIFSIAYTISQTVLVIGNFEMRVFQATDSGTYAFQEYFLSRVYTSVAMLAVSAVWLFTNGFEEKKAVVISILCLYRLSDSFGDVIEGYYQQTDRLYISGILLALRSGLPAAIFIILLAVTHNLILSSFCLMLFSNIFMLIFDFGLLIIKEKIHFSGGKRKTAFNLLMVCFPLFVSCFLATYILNAPKYAIDRFLSEELQTYYGIIFMPSFVINLISGFIFKPFLLEITSIWEQRKVDRIMTLILKMALSVLGITFICVIGGWLIGMPVLAFIYGLDDIVLYKSQLIIILIGGGLNAYSIFLYYILTVMRKQRAILAGYLIVFFEAVILSNIMVRRLEINGAAWSFLVCNLSLLFIFAAEVFINLKNK